ncbi:MAG: hypothetical protein C0468_05995 [Planctomyces sp.]|nr:hypothetical protein [Planctomyces sp.]
MPLRVAHAQTTPNPAAVRFTLSGALPPEPALAGRLRAYRDAGAARSAGDALAQALMGLPGVTGVLIHADWLTVTAHAGADWKSVRAHVDRCLAGAAP